MAKMGGEEVKYTFILYILRWMVLAIPGAMCLMLAQRIIPNVYMAMVMTQGVLGAVVFFVDKWIFRGEVRHSVNGS